MTTCFVIGPIGDKQSDPGTPGRVAYETAMELYESVIVAACGELGIEALRADQISVTGDITDQIFRRLFEADIVIADLTGGNANVMYELGLRHSLDALTIQIADKDTALPFDVKAVRTILVKRTEYGLIEARKSLVEAMRLGLGGESDPVAATRVWRSAQLGILEEFSTFLEPDLLPGDEDEDGYIEMIAGMVEAFPRLTTITEEISDGLQEINALTTASNADINKLNAANAPMAARITAIHEFAGRLEEKASGFNRLTVTFKDELVQLDKKVSPLLVYIAENPELQTAETDVFLSQIATLAGSAREGLEGLGSFATAAARLGGMSKSLKKPAAQIAGGVGRMAEAVALLEDWAFAVERIQSQR